MGVWGTTSLRRLPRAPSATQAELQASLRCATRRVCVRPWTIGAVPPEPLRPALRWSAWETEWDPTANSDGKRLACPNSAHPSPRTRT